MEDGQQLITIKYSIKDIIICCSVEVNMKVKRIVIIIIGVVLLGIFLWRLTSPIKIEKTGIVRVTGLGYDSRIDSTDVACIRDAIHLVETIRTFRVTDEAVEQLGGDSPDLMVVFWDKNDNVVASISIYGYIVCDGQNYYYLLNTEDSINERLDQLCKKYNEQDASDKKNQETTIHVNENKMLSDSSFQNVYEASWYGQVYQGNYYYLRKDKEENGYVIFKNDSECLTFDTPENGCLSKFARYGDYFYFIVYIPKENTELVQRIYRISEKEQVPQMCFQLESKHTVIEAQNIKYISDNKIWYAWKGTLYGLQLDNGNMVYSEKMPLHLKKAGGKFSVQNGLFYYEFETKGKVKVYSFDRENGNEKKLFSYKGKSQKLYQSSILQRGNWILTTSYNKKSAFLYNVVTKKRTDISICKKLQNPCSMNDNYLFYVDKNYNLHRYTLSDGTDKLIYKKCIGVACTQDIIFAQKYEKSMMEEPGKDEQVLLEGDEDDLEQVYMLLQSMGLTDEFCGYDSDCQIYQMTIDGEKVKRIR